MSRYSEVLESIFTSEQKYTVLQLIKALISAVEELAGHTVVNVGVSQTYPSQGEPTTVTLTLSFDDNTTTNLSFTVPAGRQGIQGATGPQGEQGVGIRSCNIEQLSDDRFAIEFTLDDNRIVSTDWITLPEGPQGPQGPQGPAGADGMTIVEASGTFATDRDAIIAAWPKVIYSTSANIYYYATSLKLQKYLMYRLVPGDNGRMEINYIQFRATDGSYSSFTMAFAGNIDIPSNASNINVAPSCYSIVEYITGLLASVPQLPANFSQGDMLVGDSRGGLTRLQHGTTGQFLGSDQNGLPEWQTPSGGGGGDTVQGGYNFSVLHDVGEDRAAYLVLGRNNNPNDSSKYGKYGWFADAGYAPYANVSMIVFTEFDYDGSDFVSMTQNVLYRADGTVINNHAGLVAAVGKLCYLKGDCHIEYAD